MRPSLALKLTSATSLLALAVATPALAADGAATRFSGSDRYATAVAISAEFGTDIDVVYVASGLTFPDALSAAPAAALQNGPLLLTRPDVLPADVAAAIDGLDPELIVVVGGVGSVSDSVFTELAGMSEGIRRDAGRDRYETSRIVNENAFAAGETSAAFLADGRGFPDALSASGAAGSEGSPVILVDGSGAGIDEETSALLGTLGVTSAKIAGGQATVSAGIQSSLDAAISGSVTRLAGADRYATSRAINKNSFSEASEVYFAGGVVFADALAGAALAGYNDAPLYIVPSTCVSAEVAADVRAFGTPERFLLGGASQLSAGVADLTPCRTAPVIPPAFPPVPTEDRDCPDFATSADAQAYYLYYFPRYGDISRLDRDEDGRACEFNPDV